MYRWRKRWNNFIKQKNAGLTLVEVIVSFAVLMLIIVSFYQAVTFSTRILERSDEMQDELEATMQAYYGRTPEDEADGTDKNGIRIAGTEIEMDIRICNVSEGEDASPRPGMYYFVVPDRSGGGTP